MLLLACLPESVQGATVYKRITTLEELGDGGRFLIVAYKDADNKYHAMTGTSGNYSTTATDLTISDDKISEKGSALVWTIQKESDGTYSISSNDTYISYAGSGTTMSFSAITKLTDNQKHTVKCNEDGTFTFTCKATSNRYLGFNVSSPRFAYYQTPPTTSYHAPNLYKETDDDLKDAGLTWGENNTFSCTTANTETFTQPTLSNPNSLTVTYESDQTAVATVNGNGIITLTGQPGTAHITAKSEANETYAAGTAVYTIIVNQACTNIRELKELITTEHNSVNKTVPFEATLNNAIVTYATTTVAYIQDATGGIYINTKHDLNEGTSISGTISGTAYLNNELREINKIDVFQVTAEKATITAEEVTIADLLANFGTYECKRIKIKGVNLMDSPANYTWTLEQNGSTITLFRRGTTSINATVGSNVNVTGYPYMDGENPKIDIRRQTACELNITISALGYATYYNDVTFKPATGLEAGIITATNDNKLTIDWNICASNVPNGTGILLRGEPGTYACETGANGTAPTNNLLQGSITAQTPTDTGYKYYKLANGEDGLGFYWGEKDGAPFESGAFKAYLAIPENINVNARALLLDELETGIAHVSADDDNTAVNVYSLDGRCVRTNAAPATALDGLQKGLYIVNGKKYIVK